MYDVQIWGHTLERWMMDTLSSFDKWSIIFGLLKPWIIQAFTTFLLYLFVQQPFFYPFPCFCFIVQQLLKIFSALLCVLLSCELRNWLCVHLSLSSFVRHYKRYFLTLCQLLQFPAISTSFSLWDTLCISLFLKVCVI